MTKTAPPVEDDASPMKLFDAWARTGVRAKPRLRDEAFEPMQCRLGAL